MAVHQHQRRPETDAQPAAPVAADVQQVPSQSQYAAPASGLRVGAVDDVEEVEAESVAHDVVAALRESGPISTPSVTPSSSSVTALRRSPAETIGAAGGSLDDGAMAELQSARGGGSALPDSVRSVLEPVMGADLGHVRVHTGDRSRELNAGMQAAAFTVGSDVFFRDGFPDLGSSGGQRLLAHELTHTLQHTGVRRSTAKVRRFWPFKPKSEAEVQAAAQKKQLEQQRKQEKEAQQKQLKANEARMKQEAKEAKLNAKTANANNQKVASQIAASYEKSDSAKLDMTTEHRELITEFQSLLEQEQRVRSEAHARVLKAELAKGGEDEQAKEDAKAKADVAAETAAEILWTRAPETLRAFRPLRFDDFDKAMNELREFRQASAMLETAEVGDTLKKNEASFGAPMEVEDAVKQVRSDRAIDQRRARVAKENKTTVDALDQQDKTKTTEKIKSQVGEIHKDRITSPGERQRINEDAEKSVRKEQYGGADTTASDILGGISTGAKYGGKGVGGGVKLFGKKEEDPTQMADLVGKECVTGLSSILDLVKQIIDFCTQIGEIRKGGAGKDAGMKALSTGNSMLKSAADTTKSVMDATKSGLESFGSNAGALSDVSSGLPIIGLIGSALAVIQSTIDSIPITSRFAGDSAALESATLDNKAPLAAALGRTNRRNGQLLEQNIFAIAKDSTMIGLHIAEIASAGGFGVPMAAKLAVTLTSLGHKAAHKVHDLYIEEQAAKATKAYFGGHKEGASRDLVQYDAGTAIDLIILAAQKHKLGYARAVLRDYGLEDGDIDMMRINEIREVMLEKLKETGEPKQLGDKVDEGFEKLKSLVGSEGGGGGGDEKSTWEKLKGVPGDIKKGLLDAKQAVSEKYGAAKKLIDDKNKAGYKGVSTRGTGSVLQEMVRGSDNSEKSYGKLRKEMVGNGAAPGSLPYSDAHKKQMQEKADAIKQSQTKGTAKTFDPQLAKKLEKATLPDLYDLAKTIDPADEGNIELLQWEIDRRLALANA